MKAYAEVEDTGFIALQVASDADRTCVYGFWLKNVTEAAELNVQTQFVCFATGKYILRTFKEYCVEGEKGCEIDPGAISIGIGNIKVFEPTIHSFPSRNPQTIFDRYPSRVTVNIIEEGQPRIPVPELPPSLRPLE